MLVCMYRVTLSPAQRAELQQRTRQRGLASSTRDRLEMVRLSDAGWSVPRIARHLRLHPQTVRAWIKAFVAGGFDALPNQPRGGSTSALTPAILDAVRADLSHGDRTWTARQLADHVAAQYGVRLSPNRLRLHLNRAGLSWQRTSRSLRHKQDPDAVAATRAQVAALEKKAMPG
jgi:transposase